MVNAAQWTTDSSLFWPCSVWGCTFMRKANSRSIACLCGDSDSGTATGDGTGGVGTSDMYRRLRRPGADVCINRVETSEGPAVHTDDQHSHPPTTEPCTLSSQEMLQGFTECTFTYPAVNVDQLKFFVSTDSTYCQQSPSPCQTIASVRLGEHFEGDTLAIVIFSAPLVADSGVQLDLGEQTVLQLSNKQVAGAVRCDEGCDGLRSGGSSVHSRFCSAGKRCRSESDRYHQSQAHAPQADSLDRYDIEEVTPYLTTSGRQSPDWMKLAQ